MSVKAMEIELECIGCRKIKKFDIPEIYPVCSECMEYDKQRHEILCRNEISESCPLCGYSGLAMQNHHIYGRKNSDITIRICANCHCEIHMGVREINNG